MSIEFDSDINDHNLIVLPLTSVSEESTVLLEEEESHEREETDRSDIEKETPQVNKCLTTLKRTLSNIYENVNATTTSQIKKNKNEKHMSNINEMKSKIYETELKIKQEALEANRRKYEGDEEESRLRREILKVELEIAKSKLEKEKKN